jgi:predicted Zn-dependent protease
MRQRRGLLVATVGACLACATAGERKGGAVPAPIDHFGTALPDGERALRAGDLPRAEALLRAAAEAAPADPRPLLALAKVHVAQRRFADAVRDLDGALAIRETPAALALRGRALGLDRRFDEAARDLGRALALDARTVEAWAVLAAVEVNRGDQLEAERAFAGAAALAGKAAAVDRFWTQLRAMPPDPVAPEETLDRCTRGCAAGMEGEWLEAERELRNGLRYAPRYAWCLALWAESVGRTGDLSRAERLFREALAAFSAAQRALRADAEGRLAALLVSSGKDAAEAARLARGALAVRGDRAALLYVLARACELDEDAACARDAYGRMLALPHLPEALRAGAETRLEALGAVPAGSRQP